MIQPFSHSYPVRAAAIAAGIDYGLALAWVDAPTYAAGRAVRDRIIETHGLSGYGRFQSQIGRAWDLGLVRVRRWPGKWGGR